MVRQSPGSVTRRTAGRAASSRAGCGPWSDPSCPRSESRRALEALLEALDLTRSIENRLLARIERVAVGAHVNALLRARGADDERRVAGRAGDLRLVILRMDVGLHERGSPGARRRVPRPVPRHPSPSTRRTT